MDDQKLENMLNLALEATPEEREQSENLEVGYDRETERWEVIVKYSGPAEELAGEDIRVTPLLGGYAVVTLPQSSLEEFAGRSQVEFIEMPKRLYFQVFQGKTASCITGVQTGANERGTAGSDNAKNGREAGESGTAGSDNAKNGRETGESGTADSGSAENGREAGESGTADSDGAENGRETGEPGSADSGGRQGTVTEGPRADSTVVNLTGKGILVGVVDSGVDYRHPAFRNPDGSSRILRLWDQSIPGNPPEGYQIGTEYTKEDIDRALALSAEEGRRLVPSADASGHGTAVLGIAAGSSEDFLYRGVAYESGLLVVKMGTSRENSFPRTTELIQGIDYLIRQAQALGRPMALNISFGNNYGSHRGDSLTETYLDNVSNIGRLCICTGTGNNGDDALHAAGRLIWGETREIQLAVSSREPTLNVQLWKAYEDELDIYLENPSGVRIGPLKETLGSARYTAGDTELLVYYGKPAPYHVTQEIYVDFLPKEAGGENASAANFYVDGGLWRIVLKAGKIRDGQYDLWLPGGNTLNRGTQFLFPEADGTLTIPSTSQKIITVAAYDSRLDAPAAFSGRGSTSLSWQKPDFAAPGVDITAPRPGGGYASFSGTSFAVPFAAGACALLMQWGIVDGNDPYLYAQKAKAVLRRSARPLPGTEDGFDLRTGFGALCLKNALR